ncbi:uncharacterized protein LOC6039924 [Culex quinquefasciatus]|uniref:uncharacterized protein LOC6039924 n=1 Tax=Culex quinquefasciatus TaxID=7176 RepID=UPI0018E2C904|nr:uncharacterized protein LOC6039924 [Culex quinquefasciatus]
MLRRKLNVSCIVEGCNSRAYSDQPVFAFPRVPETAKAWRRAIGIHPEAEILPDEGVCSLHFAANFVKKDKEDPRIVWLIPGAVPDLGGGGNSETPATPYHCRMCGSAQETRLDNAVSVMRRDKHMLPVLDICLDLNSEIHSLLPDGVCESCASTVRYITQFAESCWKAQCSLAESYAPGRDFKVEPWKRLAFCEDEPPENDPLQTEMKPGVEEEHSESEMIELIPMEEVKQEPQLEMYEPEIPQNTTIEPEEAPLVEPLPYDPPEPSGSKPPRKAREPPAKRPRPSEGFDTNESDLWACDFCNQKFAIKKLLDQHIRTHVRQLAELEKKRQLQLTGQFRCLKCQTMFPTAEELKVHFAAQHQKKIECKLCNVTFNFAGLLDRHNAQMHPELVKTKRKY